MCVALVTPKPLPGVWQPREGDVPSVCGGSSDLKPHPQHLLRHPPASSIPWHLSTPLVQAAPTLSTPCPPAQPYPEHPLPEHPLP